jgi:hypothetical protein
MAALKTNELYANELSQNFQQLFEEYHFLSFYETKPIKHIGLVSVAAQTS